MCKCSLKDSKAWLDHINGRKRGSLHARMTRRSTPSWKRGARGARDGERREEEVRVAEEGHHQGVCEGSVSEGAGRASEEAAGGGREEGGRREGEGEGKEYIKKDISNEISQKDRFPYKEITDLYNQICTDLPACVKLSESRKKAIRARLSSGYTVEDFKTLFQKTKDSSFLTGGNNRNWIAGFDWLIKDNNMAKVLEGTYDDRSMAARSIQEQKSPLPAPKSIYREL